MGNKTGNIIGVSLIGLMGVGIGLFFVLRKKPTKDTMATDTPIIPVLKAGSTEAVKPNVGYLTETMGSVSNLTVHFSPRPPADTIKAGNNVRLTNMGKYNGNYVVKKTWIDGAGNLGAIYLDSDKVTAYAKENKAFEHIGNVSIIV